MNDICLVFLPPHPQAGADAPHSALNPTLESNVPCKPLDSCLQPGRTRPHPALACGSSSPQSIPFIPSPPVCTAPNSSILLRNQGIDSIMEPPRLPRWEKRRDSQFISSKPFSSKTCVTSCKNAVLTKVSYDYCFNVNMMFITTHHGAKGWSGNKHLHSPRGPVPSLPCPS